ncbi:MAG: DUF1015 family protein [Actinomycetota bacterium]|nr:DUF1015 family protein [Actinomycetota bacterium]
MLRPIPAAVVRPAWAERVVSPAYDAITPDERDAHVRSNRDSFLAVTVSPHDESSDAEVEAALAAGEEALARLLAADAWEPPSGPAYHLYELRVGEHRQIAVVGELDVAAANDGWLRRHERTRPRRVDVLARHVERLGIESSPIAAAIARGSGLAPLVDRLVAERPPERDFALPDGLTQRVWRVDDEVASAELAAVLADQPAYIVDGHHRADAWSTERARSVSGDAGMLVAAFPAEQLRVLPYHRLVVARRSAGEVAAFESALAERFVVRPVDSDPPAPAAGTIGVRVGERWRLVELGPVPTSPDVVDRLDAVRLQQDILGPLLGIADPGRDPRLEVVAGTTPVEELGRRADDAGGIGFALAATTVDEVVAVADAGGVMPPKSTYFDPKVRSGVFLRRVAPEARRRPAGR